MPQSYCLISGIATDDCQEVCSVAPDKKIKRDQKYSRQTAGF